MNKTTGEEGGGERKASLGLSVWGTAWCRRRRDWSWQRQPAVTCAGRKSSVWLCSEGLLAFNQRGSVLSGVLTRKACVAFTSPRRQGQVVAVLHFVPPWPLLNAVTQNTHLIIRVIHHGYWHFITRTVCRSCFPRHSQPPGERPKTADLQLWLDKFTLILHWAI